MMTKKYKIFGATGKVDSQKEFISRAREFIFDSDSLLQFIDADKVLGKEHMLSAVEHAYRSFERKENISSSKAMEILIYAAGEPQISMALEKIGLKDGCENIALVIDGDLDINDLLAHLELERDDEVLEYKEFKLKEFGIGKGEITAVEKDKIKELVLERVSMVDVKK